MQIRTPLAAVLLSCAALAQDGSQERKTLPDPFAPKPRQFTMPKRIVPAQPSVEIATPAGSSVDARVCSIPLINVTPPAMTARMPVLPTSPNSAFTMKFADPPAPPCKDDRAGKRQTTPDRRP